MPHGITQCYLPPGRGDIPALTLAGAGTRLSDPGGVSWRYKQQISALMSSIVKNSTFIRRQFLTFWGTSSPHYLGAAPLSLLGYSLVPSLNLLCAAQCPPCLQTLDTLLLNIRFEYTRSTLAVVNIAVLQELL